MSAEPRPAFGRDARGSTAAEFAIVLPVLVLMLFAGIQFGLAQHSSGAVGYALEKAGRSLVLNPAMDETAVRTVVLSHLDASTAANVTVSLVKEAAAGGGQVARVTGVYTSQIGLPSMAALPFSTTRVVVTPLPEL